MTLQRFLTLTATVPTLTLRHAITLAMSVERPTSREGYARFYGRVLAVLDATGHPDCDVAAQRVLEGTTTTEGGMTSTPIAEGGMTSTPIAMASGRFSRLQSTRESLAFRRGVLDICSRLRNTVRLSTGVIR